MSLTRRDALSQDIVADAQARPLLRLNRWHRTAVPPLFLRRFALSRGRRLVAPRWGTLAAARPGPRPVALAVCAPFWAVRLRRLARVRASRPGAPVAPLRGAVSARPARRLGACRCLVPPPVGPGPRGVLGLGGSRRSSPPSRARGPMAGLRPAPPAAAFPPRPGAGAPAARLAACGGFAPPCGRGVPAVSGAWLASRGRAPVKKLGKKSPVFGGFFLS